MDRHVLHVIRDLDAASGGPSRSVPALARAQARSDGWAVSLVYRDRGRAPTALPGAPVSCRAVSGATRGALDRVLAAELAAGRRTLLHLHGLWSPTLHRAARFAAARGLPYVVSTRGMLADWALRHRALRKKLAWRAYQARDLASAAGIVASSDFERRCIAGLLPHRRVVVIPNGCEGPPEHAAREFSMPGAADRRCAVALGRLHPVKGYAELIEAWARLDPAGWKLVIAGPDEGGHRRTLEDLAGSRGLAGRVHFIGEVSDADKWGLLDRCELFLAPSRSENFGMAIAEALQAGKPVLTTTGTPWRELPDCGGGWWVDLDGPAFLEALRDATGSDPAALARMGGKGRQLVRERYGWDSVAARTLELYRSIMQEKSHGP